MKQRSYLGILATLLISTAVWAEGTPKIQFDHTTYDFGTTALVSSVTGTFTYSNAGDGVLKLQPPVPGCGCTIAKVSTNILNPGDKGELVFNLSLGTVPHRMNKIITVPSNDPQNPAVVLNITVETKSVLEISPANVHLGDIHLGSTTNVTLTVRRIDGKDLTIDKVESTDPAITNTIEPVKGNPKEAIVHLAVKLSPPPRQTLEQIRLFVPDSTNPAGVVLMSGRLTGDVKVDPIALIWTVNSNPGPAEMNRTRTLVISTSQTEHPLQPHNINCNIPELKVQVRPMTGGTQYELVVTLPEVLKDSMNGQISFDTDVPSLPTVIVPVQVNVLKQALPAPVVAH